LPFLSPLQPDQRPHWLTPDVILIRFLPALVFEGGVKIDVRDLLRDSAPLLVLANVGVLLATPGDWFIDSLDDWCTDSDSAVVRGTFPYRDRILDLTFRVVVSSILAQGLTMRPLLRILGLADGQG
jgi:NhaP-type Na+/H+ or K+/H+ antiporter